MTISLFTYRNGRKKYRVSLLVAGKFRQRYFDYNSRGLREAKRCERELKREQRDARQALGGVKSYREHGDKFKTGVIGVRLHPGGLNHRFKYDGPSFRAYVCVDGVSTFSKSASLCQYGYVNAWRIVVGAFFKYKGIREPIPEPPNKAAALEFVKLKNDNPNFYDF